MSNCKYKFSVVTAVYNVEPFIREAIDSIIAQDIGFENIELILVDDGSTDKSGEICDEYAARYPDNITVLHKQNGGVSSARNEGMRVASGEYVNFFDSDDKFSEDAFSKVWEFICEKKEEADVFCIPLEFFDGATGPHLLNTKFDGGSRIIDLEAEPDIIQQHTNSAFIKRECLEGLLFDTSLHFSEDSKLLQQLFLKRAKLGVFADTVYYYRKRTTGEASALQNSVDKSQWYLPVVKSYYKGLLSYALEQKGCVPQFIQSVIMYDMQWRIKQTEIGNAKAYISEEGKEEYFGLLKEALSYIDDSVILSQKNLFEEHKVYALKLKYGTEPTFETLDGDIVARFPEGACVPLSSCRTVINSVTFANGKFLISGYVGLFNNPFDKVSLYLEINGERTPCEITKEDVVSKCLGEFTGKIYMFTVSFASDNTAKTLNVGFSADLEKNKVLFKNVIFRFIPSDAENPDAFDVDAYRHIKADRDNAMMVIVCDEAPDVESAISLKDVQIKYRCLNKISLLKAIMNPKNFSKTEYFEAVKGVSFEVEKGKILGIVGKNGSGKSTLLRAIAGIFSPDEGTIDLHGHTISLLSIGVGFQNALTGRENIYLSGMLLGFDREQIEGKIEEIIEFSELGEFIDRPVKTYSSGMYSKLAFSITAILETEIMLIDEVLSVGDARFKKKSYAKMKELIGNKDRTVIIVSHSSETLNSLCDNILWLHDGEIRMFGTTGEVLPAYNKFMS